MKSIFDKFKVSKAAILSFVQVLTFLVHIVPAFNNCKILFQLNTYLLCWTLILAKLISRKIWVTKTFFKFPHCVVKITQYGNYRNALSHFCTKNSVKAVFAKIVVKSWFHGIFFREREFLVFPHCELATLTNHSTM